MDLNHETKSENVPQRTRRIRTEEERAADDRALLASGTPLATLAELAAMMGMSAKNIRRVLNRDDAPPVRYLKATTESPSRFAVVDVKAAVEPHREEIEERQRRALLQAAEERAAAGARKAARAAAHVTHVAAKAGRAQRRPSHAAPSAGSRPQGQGSPSKGHSTPFPPRPTRARPEPEVIVVRRRPGTTP